MNPLTRARGNAIIAAYSQKEKSDEIPDTADISRHDGGRCLFHSRAHAVRAGAAAQAAASRDGGRGRHRRSHVRPAVPGGRDGGGALRRERERARGPGEAASRHPHVHGLARALQAPQGLRRGGGVHARPHARDRGPARDAPARESVPHPRGDGDHRRGDGGRLLDGPSGPLLAAGPEGVSEDWRVRPRLHGRVVGRVAGSGPGASLLAAHRAARVARLVGLRHGRDRRHGDPQRRFATSRWWRRFRAARRSR